MQEKASPARRIVRTALMALLTVVLLAAFYIAVIMGNPQETSATALTVRQDQPLVSPLDNPLLITAEGDLGTVLNAFPAPMMAAMHSAVLTFEKGVCRDVPFEDGRGRIATLTYRTAEGAAVTVSSIYPARALSLIDKADFTISANAGLPLAGLRSVRMENTANIRMHAQGSEALYVVTLPRLSATALRTLTSTLQLYQGE